MNSPVLNHTGNASAHLQATAWTKVTRKRRSRFKRRQRSRSPTPIPNKVPSSAAELEFRRRLIGIEPNPGPTPILPLAARAISAGIVAATAARTIAKKVKKKVQKAKTRKSKSSSGLLNSAQMSRQMSMSTIAGRYGYNFASSAASQESNKVSIRNVGVRVTNQAALGATGGWSAFNFVDGAGNSNSFGLDINPSAGGGFKPGTFGPTIADLAVLYTLWRVTKLRVRFVPVHGTTVGGSVFICSTPDPVDVAPASEFAVMSATPNFSFPLWQETELEIPPSVFQGSLPWYHTTYGGQNNEAYRQAAPCSIQGGFNGLSTWAAGSLLGYIFFDADLEFRVLTRILNLGASKPILNPQSQSSSSSSSSVDSDTIGGLHPGTSWDMCEKSSVSTPVDSDISSHITDLTRKALLEKQLALVREKLAALDA